MAGIVMLPNMFDMGGGELTVETVTLATRRYAQYEEKEISLNKKLSSMYIVSFAGATAFNIYDTTGTCTVSVQVKYSDSSSFTDRIVATAFARSDASGGYTSSKGESKEISIDKNKIISKIILNVNLKGIKEGGATGHGCLIFV